MKQNDVACMSVEKDAAPVTVTFGEMRRTTAHVVPLWCVDEWNSVRRAMHEGWSTFTTAGSHACCL